MSIFYIIVDVAIGFGQANKKFKQKESLKGEMTNDALSDANFEDFDRTDKVKIQDLRVHRTHHFTSFHFIAIVSSWLIAGTTRTFSFIIINMIESQHKQKKHH